MKQLYALMAAALLCAPLAQAQTDGETIFTYAQPGAETLGTGWGKRTANDVAIHLDNPAYAGYEVVGISVDIPFIAGCEVEPIGTAWLTSALTLDENYKNVPDIFQPVEGEVINHGTPDKPDYRLEVTFPEPYVLSAEGVYVGYTLTVTALYNSTQKYPVAVNDCSNPEGGLYMHAEPKDGVLMPPSYYTAWSDFGSMRNLVSTMRVILRGNKISHGAALTPQSNFYAETGSTKQLSTILYNYGTEPIQSIDYTITLSGDGVESPAPEVHTLSLPSPLQPELSLPILINMDIPEVSGDYTATLTTVKVNGQENLYANKSADFSLMARPWIPRKRVLLEEYTGMWCQNCPEAYVTIKQLQDYIHDDFVALAIHSGDDLQTLPVDQFPSKPSGYPTIFVDRSREIGVGAIPTTPAVVENALDVLAPADIDVDIAWTSEEHTALRAEAKVKFLDDSADGRYLLTYALVEDDMSDPSWKQRNIYWDGSAWTSSYYQTPYWDLFIGKGWDVPGIIYDEVVMLYPDGKGIEGSLPAEISAGETYSHVQTLTLADAINQGTTGSRKPVIKNPDNLRVIAILLDTATGEAANVNTSGYSAKAPVYNGTTGVDALPEADAETVATEYYSLSGLRLPGAPAEGAYIAVRHLSNGKTITAKYLQPLQ